MAENSEKKRDEKAVEAAGEEEPKKATISKTSVLHCGQ